MAQIGFLPPGARGYLLGEQLEQQRQTQGMGQLGSLIQMQGALQQQQQQQRALQMDMTFRTELGKLGPNPDMSKAATLALQFGKPDLAFQFHNLAEARASRESIAYANRLSDVQKSIDANRTRRDVAADRNATLETIAGLRPDPAPSVHVVQDKDSPTGWSYRDFRNGGLTRGAPPPSSANANVRMENTAANQLQRQYNSATNPWRDILGPVAVYRNARETGDSSQSALMAAEALRRTARVGAQRFKGEADAILGGGYRGGSLPERIENFISQELTGTPTRSTMARLDSLINAAETSALEQIGNQTRFYAGQAKGRKLPLQYVTGIPFIQGKKVVFPDGTYAEFKTHADAEKASEQWLTSNPLP